MRAERLGVHTPTDEYGVVVDAAAKVTSKGLVTGAEGMADLAERATAFLGTERELLLPAIKPPLVW